MTIITLSYFRQQCCRRQGLSLPLVPGPSRDVQVARRRGQLGHLGPRGRQATGRRREVFGSQEPVDHQPQHRADGRRLPVEAPQVSFRTLRRR